MNSPNIFGAFIKIICKFIPSRRVRLTPYHITRQTPLAHGLSLEHVISGMPEQQVEVQEVQEEGEHNRYTHGLAVFQTGGKNYVT